MTQSDREPAWSHYPHDADVGVRGYGSSVAEAFENAARAMIAQVTPLDRIAAKETVSVTCKGEDLEILLVDWLNAVIYEMATRRMLFRDFVVKIEGNTLSATMTGEALDATRHAPAVEPKGATLTDRLVARSDGGEWVAQCIVDV